MIPANVALLAYIPVACLLMADRNSARGFSLAFLIGALFLPSNFEIPLSGFPNLDKDNVTIIGILIGSVLFHPRVFDRFFLAFSDLLLWGVCAGAMLSSISNDFGTYDGASQALKFFINFILLVYLARIHLGTPGGVRVFLLTFIFMAVCYTPLALWEFRMSPQLHQTVYGYFQHQFSQHQRWGFWRPIVFFYHALALGRFFAFATFLAVLPMRRDLVQYFGLAGNWVWLVPCAGLVASLSLGPWMLFAILCGGYFLVRRTYTPFVLAPALSMFWFVLALAGIQLGSVLVTQVAQFNPERAQSLDYRLDAIEEYRTVILNRPIFGHGGWEHGRIAGRATDSQALIQLLERGFAGTALIFAWWFVALFSILAMHRSTAGTIYAQRLAGILPLLAVGLVVSTIDIILDEIVLVLIAGTLASDAWLRDRPDWRETAARWFRLARLKPARSAHP